MKRALGIIIFLSLLPFIYWVQIQLVDEWRTATITTKEFEQLSDFQVIEQPLPVVLKDKDGEIFSEYFTEWRSPLTLEEIPYFAQQLFILSEDRIFYEHKGFDLASIARAVAINSSEQSIQQGASTITQQLIRMKFLHTEKSYERKVKELLLARKFEQTFSKEEILEMYLNEMYFSNRVYGIGAAATFYFSKPLQQLHPAEIAFISAIPNNPAKYNPIQHFEDTKKRQERLLKLMYEQQLLNEQQLDEALHFPIQLTIKQKQQKHQMYADFVLDRLSHDLLEAFRSTLPQETSEESIMQQFQNKYNELLTQGLVIHTALDQKKQLQVTHDLNQLLAGTPHQNAGVVIDNATRKVVALYAGTHYENFGFNPAFQAYRQPGSVFKPLFVYGPLFETGTYFPHSKIDSRPICIGNYCPKNFGNYTYGYTSLKEAFMLSHNTAAVRSLQQVGIEDAFQSIAPFQFSKVGQEDHHYSAALGGLTYGVTPFEIADAYTSFIDGFYLPTSPIESVKTIQGELIELPKKEVKKLWKEQSVATMRDLLQLTRMEGTARGVHAVDNYVGAKTGTTNQYKDIWLVALSDRYSIAAWMGTENNRSVQQEAEQKKHIQMANRLLD